MQRASCFKQVARFHTAKNGYHAQPLFAWTERFRGCFHETRWSVWQSCFWVATWRSKCIQLPQKFARLWNHKRQEGWHKHPRPEPDRTAFRSPHSLPFKPHEWHQTNRTVSVTSSCACCGFLRSRLELFWNCLAVVVADFRNIARVRCWFRCDIVGGILFSMFALAVDRFVTIGRRTEFCFGLLMRCLFLGSPPSARPNAATLRIGLCRSSVSSG